MLEEAEELAPQFRKMIFGDKIPEKDDDFDFPTKWVAKLD